MNCNELFAMMKQEAPALENCMTKSELRLKAERKLSGIGGSKINECLEHFEHIGTVKHDKKCTQWHDCYYDPPPAFEWLPVGLFICAAVVGLGLLFWQASRRKVSPCNPQVRYVPVSMVKNARR